MASQQMSIEDHVAKVLDRFHAGAASSDFEEYFSCFSSSNGARFLGTDASENWNVEEFRAYAKPHFDSGNGWEYHPFGTRKIDILDLIGSENIAWFDESLQSKKWGDARGTGVMILEGRNWKILQYHLSFPTPNELAPSITSLISALNNSSKTTSTK